MRPDKKLELNNFSPEFNENVSAKSAGGIHLEPKRVAARALRFWWVIVLTMVLALAIAYLYNRYAERIYPVTASIIIKENYENVGAKFLYNNELINPYRNFYNELFIMKSYPLLEEVMLSLNFDVSLYREGELKTTEYYDPNFPVVFEVIGKKPYGKRFYFTARDEHSFDLQFLTENDIEGKALKSQLFNDTVKVNGFDLVALRRSSTESIKNRTFVLQFNNPYGLATTYSNRLKATWAQAGAAVVNLEVHGGVPQKEVAFLAKFIERYQHYDVEKKNKVATMALQFLDDQLLVIGDSLNLFEDQVENFKRRNIITNLGEETNRLYEKLQGFEDQKFQYKLKDNYYNYITKLLNNDQFDGIFTPESVGITDDVTANLVTRLIELQSQVKLLESYEARGVERALENPRFGEKINQIQQVKQNILRTIENNRQTQGINISFLDDQIRVVERELERLPRTERELVSIQRNYSLKENLYVYLLQKRTEAGLSKASTTSDIVVVNPPRAGGPISPKVQQNYAIAGGLGLFLPLLLFLVIEVLNNRVQSKDDIQKITDVPLIGGVGHNLSKDALVVFRKPRSAMSESFRAVRSNLNYFTGGKDHQIFLVTSSIPGEGKSFTTLNLATVFALAGKKTIVVGADLRKPKLYDDLNLHNRVGLSQYLSGLAPLEEVIQQSEIPNLSLISGGPMPPNPSELLLQPVMGNLLQQLRTEYDFVIMDTPPLSYVTDAFILAGFADHSLFVIRQDFTPREALVALQEQYVSGKISNVSILFNDLKRTGLGYGYGHGYGYNYGYGYYGLTGFKRKRASGGYYTE